MFPMPCQVGIIQGDLSSTVGKVIGLQNYFIERIVYPYKVSYIFDRKCKFFDKIQYLEYTVNCSRL